MIWILRKAAFVLSYYEFFLAEPYVLSHVHHIFISLSLCQRRIPRPQWALLTNNSRFWALVPSTAHLLCKELALLICSGTISSNSWVIRFLKPVVDYDNVPTIIRPPSRSHSTLILLQMC